MNKEAKGRAQLTASTDSISEAGRLKKNLDRSNTPRVVLNLCALLAFSRTGKNTWSAFAAASVRSCKTPLEIPLCATYVLAGPAGASMHSHWTPKAAPRAFRHAKLGVHDMISQTGDVRSRFLTISRCLHCDELIKILLNQDSNCLRTQLNGGPQVGNSYGQVLIRGVWVDRREEGFWVERLGGDKDSSTYSSLLK